MTWLDWLVTISLLVLSHTAAIWFAVQFGAHHAYWLGREDGMAERTRRLIELHRGQR